MSYAPNTWTVGDPITKTKLDNLETQYSSVFDASAKAFIGSVSMGAFAGPLIFQPATFTLSAGNNNNIAIPSATHIQLIGTPGTITGIAGGADGRMIVFVNQSGGSVSFTENDGLSSAGNRISTNGAGTVTVFTGYREFRYSAAQGLWLSRE